MFPIDFICCGARHSAFICSVTSQDMDVGRHPDIWRSRNLRPEARRRMVAFIRRLIPVICSEEFDVMIAAGNTGIMMARVAESAYHSLGIRTP